MTRAARAHLFAEIERVWQATRKAVATYQREQPWEYLPKCRCERCERVRAMWRVENERRKKK